MKFLQLITALTRTLNIESCCSHSGEKFRVKMQSVSDTPRSDARSVEPADDAAPTKQLCFCIHEQGFVVSLFHDGHLEINDFLAAWQID